MRSFELAFFQRNTLPRPVLLDSAGASPNILSVNCPACKSEMIVVEREKVEIDYCLACRGLWFDADEIRLLAESLTPGAALPEVADLPLVASKEAVRSCPRCDVPMEKAAVVVEPQVVIDCCPRGHGLWFDRGELGKAFDAHGAAKPGAGTVINFLGEVLGSETRKS